MKKKIIYIVTIIVVLILGYLNYFAPDKKIENLEPVIETTDVTYKNEDYEVSAKIQKDYVNKKETGFSYAKAKLNDMIISGDNVFIDKLRNLALKHNILGISTNGWTFKTDEANYNKKKDEITITTGVEAENKERKVKVLAKNFKTNSKMTFIELSQDVTLENDQVAILSDKGSYNDKDKVMKLSGNIHLEGRGDNVISGEFETLKYNMDNKTVTTKKPFDITYKGVNIKAKNMSLNQKTQKLYISNDVKINAKGFNITLDNIYKASNNDIVNFVGKIHGKSQNYDFVANSGIYNTKTKIFEIYGNLKATSKKGDKLVADRIIYNTNNEDLTIISKNNVKYYNKEGVLITRRINYNTKTKLATTQGNYKFIGKRYKSQGMKLSYNDITKIVEVKNGYIIDLKKNQELKAHEITYNKDNNSSRLVGKANVKNNKYEIKSDEIVCDSLIQMVDIPTNYKIKFLKENMVLSGKRAHYSELTQDFISVGQINIKGKNYTANGQDLRYNNRTKLGSLIGKATINGKNMKASGNNLDFKNNEYVKLSSGVSIETAKYTGKTDVAEYILKDDTIFIPKVIIISSKDGAYYGTIERGEYEIAKDLFVGKNLNLKSIDHKSIVSKVVKYYGQENKFKLLDDAVIKNPDYTILGNNIDYYTQKEKVDLIGKYKILYDNYTLNSNNGIFNNKLGKLMSGKTIIKSKLGDEFSSNKVSGNIKDLVLNFEGNIKGKILKDGKTTKFSGDKAKVNFLNNGKYSVKRANIKNNARVTQDNNILTSDFIDIDAINNIIYAKDNSELKVIDKNGVTNVSADVMKLDNNKNIITLDKNVVINNDNDKYDKTLVKADKGVINQNTNILELIGNLYMKNNDSTITANKGIYNINTRKIRVSGNVFVDYND